MGKLKTLINGGGYLELTGEEIAKLRRLLEQPEEPDTPEEEG